jgi:hypothetical protein
MIITFLLPIRSERIPPGTGKMVFERWKMDQRIGINIISIPKSFARRRRNASLEFPKVKRVMMRRKYLNLLSHDFRWSLRGVDSES